MLPAHSCTVATALSVLNEYSAIALQFERKRCDKIADTFVAGPMGMSPRRAGAIRSLGRAKPAAVRRASRRIFVRQSHLFRSSTLGTTTQRFVAGRSSPRPPNHTKPHPNLAYKG